MENALLPLNNFVYKVLKRLEAICPKVRHLGSFSCQSLWSFLPPTQSYRCTSVGTIGFLLKICRTNEESSFWTHWTWPHTYSLRVHYRHCCCPTANFFQDKCHSHCASICIRWEVRHFVRPLGHNPLSKSGLQLLCSLNNMPLVSILTRLILGECLLVILNIIIQLIVLALLFIFTIVVEFFINLKKDLGKIFSCYLSKSLTFFTAAARRTNAAMISKSFPSHFCIEYDTFCNRLQ